MKKKVLIIENNQGIREIVSYLLEAEGYSVEGAKYSSDFLENNLQADLILLDEWINKREGHMLCQELKAIDSLKQIPVIIFSTAFDIEAIAKKCKANGFVKKPFDLDTLIEEVKKLLPINIHPKIVI